MNMNLNTRVFGALCSIGNAIGVANYARWAIRGNGWDTIDIIVSVIMAIGGICGVLGLISLKATGTYPVLRLLSYLPIPGFLFTIASAYGQNTSSNIIAFLVQMAGMVIVGVLALATKTCSGWRKVTPLMTVLAWPMGWFIQSMIGMSGLANLIMAASWVLLGYAVLSGAQGLSVRQNQVQPARE